MSLLNYQYPLILRVVGHSQRSTEITVDFELFSPKSRFGTFFMSDNGPWIRIPKNKICIYPIDSYHTFLGVVDYQNKDLVRLEVPELGWGGVGWSIQIKDLEDSKLVPPAKKPWWKLW